MLVSFYAIGEYLPYVPGTLSSSTSLKWIDLPQATAQMKFLDASPANFSNFSGWTEVDAGTNVTLAGDSVTMNGNGTGSQNGMYWSAGLSRAAGYLQYDVSVAGSVTAWGYFGESNTGGALPNGPVSGSNGLYGSTTNLNYYQNSSAGGSSPISASTFYTIRIYIGLSNDATTWGGLYMTAEGGSQYTTETILATFDKITATYGTTIYPFIERTTANASLTTVKNAKWFSGYATDNPYVTWTHDAGTGKKFDNFDMSNMSMPGIVNSSNLKFSYSFDDGSDSYSAFQTLAQFKSNGKITGRHRYIRIKVQNALTDGTTQVYISEPNSSTATDGAGDFPSVVDVHSAATVQGTNGTLTLPGQTQVQSGVTYGGSGTDSTGSLTGGTSGDCIQRKRSFKNY